ncbi:ImmA/IrrE family metallo-endopeptidase, partial [Candidatus Parcubacteria bacterium]|nr:ImmA/IrrE family metallo-endopeptidase [Candidatus Parcubacteria bacterium]
LNLSSNMKQNNIYNEAIRLAADKRRELNIGNDGIKDIFLLLESQGLFIVRMPIDCEDLSGAFYYDKDGKTGKVLINSNRTRGHQIFTAAHEYCHYLLDKDKELIIENDKEKKSPIEQRADCFAAHFLMPQEGVDHYIHSILENKSNQLDDIELVKTRNEFGASWLATIYHLGNLGYRFDKPMDKKIKDTAGLNRLALQMGYKAERKFNTEKTLLPAEYNRMAFNSYFNKKISLNRLAEFLRISYDEAKDKIAEIKNNEKFDK